MSWTLPFLLMQLVAFFRGFPEFTTFLLGSVTAFCLVGMVVVLMNARVDRRTVLRLSALARTHSTL